MDRRLGLAALWLATTILAVTVGVVAVNTVGASIRGRGPLGDEVTFERPATAITPTPDPQQPGVMRKLHGDWGTFVVQCRGVYAYGLKATPGKGWRALSHEPGPDDDVDAVFTNQRSSVEIEVFCNRGQPTVASLDRSTLDSE